MAERPDKFAGKPQQPKQDRLATALRTNLLRRKAQARAKASAGEPAGKDEPGGE